MIFLKQIDRTRELHNDSPSNRFFVILVSNHLLIVLLGLRFPEVEAGVGAQPTFLFDPID